MKASQKLPANVVRISDYAPKSKEKPDAPGNVLSFAYRKAVRDALKKTGKIYPGGIDDLPI